MKVKVFLVCPYCGFEVNLAGELGDLKRYLASNGLGYCPKCFSKLILAPEKGVELRRPSSSIAE